MSLKHATLIALIDQEATGYEIAKWFDQGMGYFWSASHQQIYQVLAKLAENDLAAYKEVGQSGKPAKKVYRITDAGLAELERWLRQPTAPCPTKDELLMKVYAGSMAPPAVLIREIQSHQAGVSALLAQFHAIEREQFTDVPALPERWQYVYLTLRYGILHNESWLRWADEAISFLKQKEAAAS